MDTTKRMSILLSSPSFYSYCDDDDDDDDDEPISTYISLFLCFSFCYKALKNGIEKKKKKLKLTLRSEALLYGVASLKITG